MNAAGNLFAAAPRNLTAEQFDELLCGRGFRLERIVSTGQATPPGEWLESPDAEWVVLLSGSAGLRFADEEAARPLLPGDYLFIAAHRRHRVERTDATQPTTWLGMHVSPREHTGGRGLAMR